ncbi:MAG: TIGR03767 family metallophosphoesterase [Actinobacteria bacterium]|nr:TIGR03767 family metallophosphoesterase [Actinomycetota bacterium]
MTPSLSRRNFLKAAAILAAATGMPLELAEAALAAEPSGTTLDRIIRRAGSGYITLGFGDGEPHEPHPDNPVALPVGISASSKRNVLCAFVHFTDVHVVDAQSPLRVEFVDRYATQTCGPFPNPVNTVQGAFRPQETMTTHVLSAMVRAANDVQARRIAGGQRPFDFAVSTGDNTDNQQRNELGWFMAALDGASTLTPNSGGPTYEGVQAPAWGDLTYWVPKGGVADVYKTKHGFPAEDAWGYGADGLLGAAVKPFSAPPLAMPWYSAYGNHDGLIQGNMPSSEPLRQIATAPVKVAGPPVAFDPCNAFADPATLFTGPAKPITADAARSVLTRNQYIEAHLATGGGHGFTSAHVQAKTAYYTIDNVPGFRFIVLDTVNPGGFAEGSIGETQFKWLEAKIKEAADRYVILFSHHGLHSLENPFQNPGFEDPEPERRMLSGDIEPMLHNYPQVIAWVAGHTHQNRITKRAASNGHVFWDVETAAHIDWPCQNRIVEVIDDGDVLTIRLTLLDHAAPVARADIVGEADPVLKLAGIHRELAANDTQFNRDLGYGPREARNVELTLAKPNLAAGGSGGGGGSTAQGGTTDPAVLAQEEGQITPATGGPSFQMAATLALAAAAGMQRLRARAERVRLDLTDD